MKTIKAFLYSLFILAYLVTLLIACKKDSPGSGNELGGDTNLAENAVGSTSTLTMNQSGVSSSPSTQMKVVGNASGIVSVEFSVPLSASQLSAIDNIGNALYGEDYRNNKATLIDQNGKLKGTYKFKNSSEGVAIVNSAGKQCVIMNYGANVGDKWTYTKENGTVATFTVTKKSTTDDYDYAFFKIKIVQVERISNEPGISKIVYIGNHKFGLVGIEMHLGDGSVIKSTRI